MPRMSDRARFERSVVKKWDPYLRKYIPWHIIRAKWSEKERRTIAELQETADKDPTIENLTDLRIEVERIQSERRHHGTIETEAN